MSITSETVRTAEIMKALLNELKEAGGEARFSELAQRVSEKFQFTDYESGVLATTKNTRWQSHAMWTSVDFVKAGLLEKSAGKWFLTEEGTRALSKPAEVILKQARQGYYDWKHGQTKRDNSVDVVEPEQGNGLVRQSNYELAVEQAREGIEDHIRNKLGPYDFQQLVSELLTAMGFYVSRVAAPGKDGGIDIIAYRDPFGMDTPRIKVQVKHHQDKVGVQDIRQLHGLLKDNNEIGLFVSSGGFTGDVMREARSLARHLELMDLDRLIDLWQTYYDKISEKGKALLPLVTLHFLAPIQE